MQGISTYYKGHAILISPFFEVPFYDNFVERCGHQLDWVIEDWIHGGPIHYIEVCIDGALVHPSTPVGQCTPSIPSRFTRVSWKPPIGEKP